MNEEMTEVTNRQNCEEQSDKEDKKLLSWDTSCHNQTELFHRCLPHRPESQTTHPYSN